METKIMSYRDAINLAMSEEMRKDENIYLMGEDVGVYGGDFGTSVGMIKEFTEKKSNRYSNFRSCNFRGCNWKCYNRYASNS